MPERNYRQNCGIARASDLLGERWTLLIVRDLLIAPRRFSELEKRMKGMGANLLARRLKDMAAAGLIASSSARDPYSLTEMGRGLEPMVLQMVRWSLKWVKAPADLQGLHFPDWDLLALKALFTPNANLGTGILVQFRAGDWRAWVKVTSNSYAFGLGETEMPVDVNFPCLISELRAPAAILSGLVPEQAMAAKTFLSAFSVN